MKHRIAAALAFAVIAAGTLPAATEYTLTAHVNDFAGIVPEPAKTGLEQRLRTYKEATTVEIVVVTVPSLEGLTVEDFTIRLAQRAGIGTKEKDNGIVFLIAPNDRKVRIEVGYGLEPDLTDLQSKRILTERVTPRFKEGNFPQGIADGVDGILATLGQTPYQQRLQERQAAEEQKRRQDAIAAQNFWTVMKYLGSVMALAGVIAAFGFALRASIRRRRERLALISGNAELIQDCMYTLAQAVEAHKRAVTTIAGLVKTHAPRAWKDLKPKHPKNTLQERLADLVETATGSLELLHEQQRGLVSLKHDIVEFAEFPLLVDERVVKLKQIRAGRLPLLARRPADLAALDNAASHPDVTDATRKLVTFAHEQLLLTQQIVDAPGLPDYLTLDEKMAFLTTSIACAEESIAADKVFAARARTEGPELLRSLPATLEDAQKTLASDSVCEDAKEMLSKAAEDVATAVKACESAPVAWPTCFPLLTAAAAAIQAALAKEVAEKAAEERRRRDDEEEEERRRRRRRQESSRSSYYSSSSSSYESSSSSSSSDIGGGGSFGGGGGSDSW